MSPSTTVQADPRAYVRIAAMVREMISSQVLPPGLTRAEHHQAAPRAWPCQADLRTGDAPAGGRRPAAPRPRARLLRDIAANAEITPSGPLAAEPASGARTGPPDQPARTSGITERSAIRAWNVIRHADGAERSVRSAPSAVCRPIHSGPPGAPTPERRRRRAGRLW